MGYLPWSSSCFPITLASQMRRWQICAQKYWPKFIVINISSRYTYAQKKVQLNCQKDCPTTPQDESHIYIYI